MQELFWTLCSGSGGSLASNVSSEFAGNAGWFKTIQVFTKPWLLFALVIEEGGTRREYAHAHLVG